MKKTLNIPLLLRSLAAVIFAAGIAVWLSGGAHWGWTKTSVPLPFIDEVTGIEGTRWEERFVPGVEFPAAGVVVSLIFFGFSLLFKSPPSRLK